jgi:hypothetical protein
MANINNADYLIKSELGDTDGLEADNNLESYEELLSDEDTPQSSKELIINFLLPYKISLLKFTLNQEYFEQDSFLDDIRDYEYIAPSLKEIKCNRHYIVSAYPEWFYSAFPDVVIWSQIEPGEESLKKMFFSLPEGYTIEMGHFKTDLLKRIVDTYLEDTNNLLECQVINVSEHTLSQKIQRIMNSYKNSSNTSSSLSNRFENFISMLKEMDENFKFYDETKTTLSYRVDAGYEYNPLAGEKLHQGYMYATIYYYPDKDIKYNMRVYWLNKYETANVAYLGHLLKTEPFLSEEQYITTFKESFIEMVDKKKKGIKHVSYK